MTLRFWCKVGNSSDCWLPPRKQNPPVEAVTPPRAADRGAGILFFQKYCQAKGIFFIPQEFFSPRLSPAALVSCVNATVKSMIKFLSRFMAN